MEEFVVSSLTQEELDFFLDKLFHQMGCFGESALATSAQNALWRNIYRQVATFDFKELFELTEQLCFFEPETMDFRLTKPYRLNACVYDLKVYKGDIYFAIYFTLNSKLAQVCLENGFNYAQKKHIWVRRISLSNIASNKHLDFFKNEIQEFLIEILGFCHVFLNRATMKKHFNFKMVGE